MQEGRCEGHVIRLPLRKLEDALDSGRHERLAEFVRINSDGLGNPLPEQALSNLSLAVVYSNEIIPEYNNDVIEARETANRARRRDTQRFRRAAKRLGIETAPNVRSPQSSRLARHKNSTVHLVTGALVVRCWTGSWHYRQQLEMLGIMGLLKGPDFVRDRVDYLERSNKVLFDELSSWANEIGRSRLSS